jgi:RNA polymerase sigma-70 factor (ECF subfamily)
MPLTRDQFEQLALEQLDSVDRVARSLAHNVAESEDLVQETFLRAIKSWQSFDLRSFGIKPWLLRILHNTYVSRGTREAKQPKAIEDEHLQAASGVTMPVTAEEFSWESNADLARAMGQLSADLRTCLILWAVDELSYQEIADVMQIPIGTVMSRLHRARQRLRELLEGVVRPQ